MASRLRCSWSFFAFFVFYKPNYYLGHPINYAAGQSAGRPARAHCAGVVLPAVLRNPALHRQQAAWCCGHVHASILMLCSSCPGSTHHGYARQLIGRFTSSSSGCFALDCVLLGYIGSRRSPMDSFFGGHLAAGETAACEQQADWADSVPLTTSSTSSIIIPVLGLD